MFLDWAFGLLCTTFLIVVILFSGEVVSPVARRIQVGLSKLALYYELMEILGLPPGSSNFVIQSALEEMRENTLSSVVVAGAARLNKSKEELTSQSERAHQIARDLGYIK